MTDDEEEEEEERGEKGGTTTLLATDESSSFFANPKSDNFSEKPFGVSKTRTFAGLRSLEGEEGKERERETLQRANAFAIKKRYYETLPNTDEVP